MLMIRTYRSPQESTSVVRLQIMYNVIYLGVLRFTNTTIFITSNPKS